MTHAKQHGHGHGSRKYQQVDAEHAAHQATSCQVGCFFSVPVSPIKRVLFMFKPALACAVLTVGISPTGNQFPLPTSWLGVIAIPPFPSCCASVARNTNNNLIGSKAGRDCFTCQPINFNRISLYPKEDPCKGIA